MVLIHVVCTRSIQGPGSRYLFMLVVVRIGERKSVHLLAVYSRYLLNC